MAVKAVGDLVITIDDDEAQALMELLACTNKTVLDDLFMILYSHVNSHAIPARGAWEYDGESLDFGALEYVK